MKKLNLLSKAEMKNVLGGGYPPETPGGDPSVCAPKGYISCEPSNGPGTHYFYACCTTLAEAQSFCPSGSIYGCVTPQPELEY